MTCLCIHTPPTPPHHTHTHTHTHTLCLSLSFFSWKHLSLSDHRDHSLTCAGPSLQGSRDTWWGWGCRKTGGETEESEARSQQEGDEKGGGRPGCRGLDPSGLRRLLSSLAVFIRAFVFLLLTSQLRFYHLQPQESLSQGLFTHSHTKKPKSFFKLTQGMGFSPRSCSNESIYFYKRCLQPVYL